MKLEAPFNDEEQHALISAVTDWIPNNMELLRFGLTLAMIAACREGETITESQDFFRHFVIVMDKAIKTYWDRVRTAYAVKEEKK